MGPESLLYRSLKKTEGFSGNTFKSESSFPPANASCTDNHQSPLLLRRSIQKIHGCQKTEPTTATTPAMMGLSKLI